MQNNGKDFIHACRIIYTSTLINMKNFLEINRILEVKYLNVKYAEHYAGNRQQTFFRRKRMVNPAKTILKDKE